MAVYFISPNPGQLLAAFRSAIDQKHVVTWTYDKDGDFTHATDQWRGKAWLRPTTQGDRLTLNILKPQNATVSWEVYGIYHGRFIESMIVHCHQRFSSAGASAKPTTDDVI